MFVRESYDLLFIFGTGCIVDIRIIAWIVAGTV
jgi:hypothetical protein